MNNEMIKELLEKLKQCDDFHNRCDFLMEHDEITYMLDYITNLQQENKKYKEVINKAIKLIEDTYYSKNTTGIDSIVLSSDKLIKIRKILKEVK